MIVNRPHPAAPCEDRRSQPDERSVNAENGSKETARPQGHPSMILRSSFVHPSIKPTLPNDQPFRAARR
ncbi:MAG: hypothetical protein KA473_13800 [Anaerolineales bacterium]|nr:hypothetical protein [Anaerolineales bacterium]MBP6210503.1 hypothetical protein [Anaerolineales bacterium]